MSDDPVSRCTECGAPVERVFHPVAVHFKGSGFYTTDYARGRSDGKPGKTSEAKKDSDKKSGDSGSAKNESGGEKTKAGSSGD
jgi:predicted nucleic acid-binding Zn ribbon protein